MGGCRLWSPGPLAHPRELLNCWQGPHSAGLWRSRAGGGAGGGAGAEPATKAGRGAGVGWNPGRGLGGVEALGSPGGRAGGRGRAWRRVPITQAPVGWGARHVAAHGPAAVAAAVAALPRPRRTGRGPAGRCGRRGALEGTRARRDPANQSFGVPPASPSKSCRMARGLWGRSQQRRGWNIRPRLGKPWGHPKQPQGGEIGETLVLGFQPPR